MRFSAVSRKRPSEKPLQKIPNKRRQQQHNDHFHTSARKRKKNDNERMTRWRGARSMDLGLPPLEILTMKEEKRKKERMCVCCPSRVGSLEGTPYF